MSQYRPFTPLCSTCTAQLTAGRRPKVHAAAGCGELCSQHLQEQRRRHAQWAEKSTIAQDPAEPPRPPANPRPGSLLALPRRDPPQPSYAKRLEDGFDLLMGDGHG